jgi:phosphohistidine phosphatase SixA
MGLKKEKALIEGAGGPLIIVGHLPHLSRLVSPLILNDPQKETIKFKMGVIVSLTKKVVSVQLSATH